MHIRHQPTDEVIEVKKERESQTQSNQRDSIQCESSPPCGEEVVDVYNATLQRYMGLPVGDMRLRDAPNNRQQASEQSSKKQDIFSKRAKEKRRKAAMQCDSWNRENEHDEDDIPSREDIGLSVTMNHLLYEPPWHVDIAE